MHTHLMAQNGGSYSIILPIYEECIASNYHILARGGMQTPNMRSLTRRELGMLLARRRRLPHLLKQIQWMHKQAIVQNLELLAPQPKRSRKRKVPDNNLPGARSTRSNMRKGGRGGRGAGEGRGGRAWVAK